MGVILKDKLEDYTAARHEFTELDTRYPDNIYRLDVYYNMYLMAVREDNKAQSEIWRQKILEEFPDSPYGKAMADPHYFDNLRKMHQVQEELYEKAYGAYLEDDNKEVHAITADMEKEYPLSPILPKFVFIDALSYLTEGDNEQFKDRLTELLRRWPETDMTDMASGILKGLKAGRVPHAGLSNSRGMLWEIRLSDWRLEKAPTGSRPTLSATPRPRNILCSHSRGIQSMPTWCVYGTWPAFNFSSFVVKDFDLEQMSFSNIGLLIVKGFANLRELEHYRTVMEKSEIGLPAEVRPIMISKANFELLLREGRSFEDYFRFQEESESEKTEEDVVGPGMTMPGPDDEIPEESPDEGEASGEKPEEAAPEEVPEEPASGEEIIEENS